MQIALYPVDHIGITTYFSQNHKAIDLGWRKNPAPDIHAVADGQVVATGVGADGGLYVFIRHQDIMGLENKTVYTRYYHLKSYSVKAGDIVKQYDTIGVMGTTGNSTGVHLHLDLSAYPKGHSSFPSDFRAYAVNPQEYLYRKETQTVSEDSVGVKQYNDITLPQETPTAPATSEREHFDLVREPLYVSSDAKAPAGYVTGRYYPYDGLEFSGRIRITNSVANIGAKNGVTGYIANPNTLQPKTYTVQKGDSLWKIAKAKGVSLDALIKANPQIADPNLIYPNQIINIP